MNDVEEMKRARLELVDEARCKSVALLKLQYRTANMRLVPPVRKLALTVQRKLLLMDIPVFVSQGDRGKVEQDLAVARGFSKARWPKSPHNWGCAFDLVHHRILYEGDEAHYKVLSALVLEVARAANLKMVWGGDWKFYDPTHYEMSDWGDYVSDNGVVPVP